MRPSDDPDVATFVDRLPFTLDDFQTAGCRAVAEGRSTLVAAPTGAGKTVVGELACHLAISRGTKCFYTTPIKALSNQKYADLCAVHGTDRVGLLTGDHAINGEAPVVVMTTEVLRNMLYEDSPTLAGLSFAVLDEVHYLGDRERGAVWEEVIVQLAGDVTIAALSATVGNAEEVGDWLASVRPGGCELIITEERPVPLEHHYAVNDDLVDTFVSGAKAAGKKRDRAKEEAARRAESGVPNPRIISMERQASGRGRPNRRGYRGPAVRMRAPRRTPVVKELERRQWLPAIVFVFSRAGCDAGVGHLLNDGVRLTSSAERTEIRRLVAEGVVGIDEADLETLGYRRFLTGLQAGVAAHHAGMVPAFKEVVETLFVRGLVKVCFATETLALGVNMPARTVVIERLEKWMGTGHALLTPGQFTQLTGRAGRRGLDTVGHAVVLHQRDIDFRTVASLVQRRTEALSSSFRPSANMAVNLLRRHDRAAAEELLARSFAQFQADRTVADDEVRLERNRVALEGYATHLSSDVGDFVEYWGLRRELSRIESASARDRKDRRRDAVESALLALEPGDVVGLPAHDAATTMAVIVEAASPDAKRPLTRAVTDDRRLVRIGPREFGDPPVRAGHISLPRSGSPRQSAYRKAVVQELEAVGIAVPREKATAPVRTNARDAARIEELREALRRHPVHRDPQLPEIEVWARRHDQLLTETERLTKSVRRRTGSLVRQLDRLVGLLLDMGYLEGPPEDPQPSEDGLMLARLYVETDLVLAECLRTGVLEGLGASDLAAIVSLLTFETRVRDAPPPQWPSADLLGRGDTMVDIRDDIAARLEDASLPVVRDLDAGLVAPLWRWATGAELDDALEGEALTPGDFVRATKQVADLLGQIRDATADPVLATTARAASRAIVRGVVAHSGLD